MSALEFLAVMWGVLLVVAGAYLLLGMVAFVVRERRLGYAPSPLRVAAVLAAVALLPAAGLVLLGLGGGWW